MTEVLSVALSVPVALILAAALTSAWARFSFARAAGTFRCKVRAPCGRAAAFGSRWRRWTQARWVHDVLLVQRGLLHQRVVALAVRLPEDAIRAATPGEVGGLGRQPQILRLRLDDGPLIEVAAPSRVRTLVVGPFLAAAIPGLPEPSTERPPGGR